MPQEGRPSDMDLSHLLALDAEAGILLYPKVQDPADTVFDVLGIHLAEIPEVVLPYESLCCSPHEAEVHLAIVERDEVSILPVLCRKPVKSKRLEILGFVEYRRRPVIHSARPFHLLP